MPNRNLCLAIAFLAGCFFVGVPYWGLPYEAVQLPDSLSLLGLGAVAVLAFTLVALKITSARLAGIVMVASPVAAILARVIADTAKDPGSHNLWPLELFFTLFAAGLFVLPVVILAALVRRRRVA